MTPPKTPKRAPSPSSSEDSPTHTPPKKTKSTSSKSRSPVKKESGHEDEKDKERERGKSKITPEVKMVLAEKAMELASKSLDYRALSSELNIPETALKDQFKAHRSNLRKAILDSVSAGK